MSKLGPNSIRNNMIFEYIVTIAIFIISYIPKMFPPHFPEFLEGDMTISHTCGETYNSFMTYSAYFVPVILVAILVLLFDKDSKWMDLHVMFILSIKNLCMVTFFTDVWKNVVGRPRPCALDMCGYTKVSNSSSRLFGTLGQIGSINNCSAPTKYIWDAFRSFPSGHSSITMSGAVLALLFFVKFSSSFHHQKPFIYKTYRYILFVLSLAIPCVIGGSRIYDYKHRGDDIAVGYLLGAIISYLDFKQFFTFHYRPYSLLKQTESYTDIEVHAIETKEPQKL
ncbi:hypothetical protein WA158_007650 [Blastocystis sp. Blastoise]